MLNYTGLNTDQITGAAHIGDVITSCLLTTTTTTTTTQHVTVDSEWSSSLNVQNGHQGAQFISFTCPVPAEMMSVLS